MDEKQIVLTNAEPAKAGEVQCQLDSVLSQFREECKRNQRGYIATVTKSNGHSVLEVHLFPPMPAPAAEGKEPESWPPPFDSPAAVSAGPHIVVSVGQQDREDLLAIVQRAVEAAGTLPQAGAMASVRASVQSILDAEFPKPKPAPESVGPAKMPQVSPPPEPPKPPQPQAVG